MLSGPILFVLSGLLLGPAGTGPVVAWAIILSVLAHAMTANPFAAAFAERANSSTTDPG